MTERAPFHPEEQARLAQNIDAVECKLCELLFMPERYDGELIVNVVRLSDAPPGTPGSAVCPECFKGLFETGVMSRDTIAAS